MAFQTIADQHQSGNWRAQEPCSYVLPHPFPLCSPCGPPDLPRKNVPAWQTTAARTDRPTGGVPGAGAVHLRQGNNVHIYSKIGLKSRQEAEDKYLKVLDCSPGSRPEDPRPFRGHNQSRYAGICLLRSISSIQHKILRLRGFPAIYLQRCP